MLAKLTSFLRKSIVDALETVTSIKALRRLYGISFYRNWLHLTLNSSVLITATGFVFWIVAARLYSEDAVGVSAAAISAMGLLASLSTLGFDYGLVRFLPDSKQPSALANSCFTIASILAVVLSGIFILGVPFWSHRLNEMRTTPLLIGAFIVSVMANVLWILTQQVFVARRRSGLSIVPGLVFGLLRFAPLPFLMARAASYGVFISWMLAMAAAAAVSVLIMPLAQSGYRPMPMIKRRQVHQLLGFSLESLAASFLWALPGFVLPLIVINMMDAQHNAYFSMAWRTSTLLTSLGSSLEMVLLAELSNDVQGVSVNTRRSLKLVLLFLLPVTLLVVLLAGKILLAFGSGYSAHGTTVLRLLALGSLPATLNLLYFARKRLEKTVGEVIVFAGATSVATIALTAILVPHLGIIAPAVAWLASQSVAAMLTLPRLLRIKSTVAPDQQV